MSKIEKALEKAKTQRQDKFIYSIPITNDANQNEEEPMAQIQYTQTRTVEIKESILRKNRLMAFFEGSPFSDQYRILKTKILAQTRRKGLNTILVTSAMDNEGKSLTAANLAISLAKELQQTVLLVDANLRRPTLHKLFDLPKLPGLSDYLVNHTPLPELLITPGIDKLTLLTGHESLINSTEIIGSTRMEELVKEMKSRYKDRYIIFDSPPILGCADALILSDYVDGIILVVEYDKTKRTQLKKAFELIKRKKIIGTVLNKSSALSHEASYSYSK